MNIEDISRHLESFESRCFGAGAKEDEIARAEHILGVKLRGGYRRFLARFGWGGVMDVEIYGLGSDTPTHLELTRLTLSERIEMTPRLPIHLIPLMNDGGGNLYCLDCSTPGDEPRIVFWDHTDTEAQTPETMGRDFFSWLMSYIDSSAHDIPLHSSFSQSPDKVAKT